MTECADLLQVVLIHVVQLVAALLAGAAGLVAIRKVNGGPANGRKH